MSFCSLVTLVLCHTAAVPRVSAAVASRRSLGTVTGTVRDSRGNPLAGALVSLLRDGANQIVKETRSGSDGSFITRVAPGRYLLRAVAEGFSPATFTAVQINPAAEVSYRFNLEPVGNGRTAPERRVDRNDPKFRIRASQIRRSVFQAEAGANEVVEAAADAIEEAEADTVEQVARGDEEAGAKGRTQGVVETYFASSAGANATGPGLNFAFASPVTENLDFIFAGQVGALNRLETTARLRAGERHRLSASLGGTHLRLLHKSESLAGEQLGQVSARAVDEWVVRDGVVVVLGFDYSRFVGASQADSFSPRLGFQFDAGARTRLKAAYAPGGDEESVQGVSFFEDAPVVFHEQKRTPLALVKGQPDMERSRRLEFGLERVLDNASSIEATAFFDTTDGRGVGLLTTPLDAFASDEAVFSSVVNQQGAARGLRLVYTRRFGSRLKASAGYALGRGQKLSPEGLTNPEEIFHAGFFQSAAAQLDADLLDGTRVRTVLRFSPRAAVFAIDPFAGRLAVYDPSLSVLVSRELPNFGLPLRAEAVLDARNLLDILSSIEDGENFLSVNASRRMVRGGISVRF